MSRDPVWIDGSFAGRIDPRDRGLTLGDGVFDTLAAFRRIPFAGARHLRRLEEQAEAIGIALDPEAVREGWGAVLARAEAEHIVLRTTVTRGVSGRGLWPASAPAPTLVVAAAPWSQNLFGAPARLVTSAILRHPASPSSRLKTLGYLDNVLAAREAAGQGADDAIFLTPAGNVACSTIANIFLVRGDELATPPLSDGVQPGITRRLVLDAAGRAGLRSEERSLSRQDVCEADAVFLTNSVRFLSPVLALDGAAIATRGSARLTALVATIADQVRNECGFDPRPGQS